MINLLYGIYELIRFEYLANRTSPLFYTAWRGGGGESVRYERGREGPTTLYVPSSIGAKCSVRGLCLHSSGGGGWRIRQLLQHSRVPLFNHTQRNQDLGQPCV